MRADRTVWTLAGMEVSSTEAHQPVAAAVAFEVPVLDERLDDLLYEERVAAGAITDQLAEAVQRRVRPEQVGEQLLDRLRAEGASAIWR